MLTAPRYRHKACAEQPLATRISRPTAGLCRSPAPPRSLVLLNWSEYIDPELVEKFELRFDALMVREFDEHIEYVPPAEGGNIWVDYLAVLESSRNKELAWAFINFLNEPEHAAQLAQYVYYATPNTAAEKLLPQEFLDDPVIYPSKESLARSEFHTPLPPRAVKKRNLAFAHIE